MPRRRNLPWKPVDPGQLSDESIEYNKHWNALLPKESAHQALRDGLYGCRIEDSPNYDSSFVVRCSCMGIVAGNLTIGEARRVMEDHVHNASSPTPQ
jgi:hypothetical protein